MNKIKVCMCLVVVLAATILWFVIKQSVADDNKNVSSIYEEIQIHLQRLYMTEVQMYQDWSEYEVRSLIKAVKEMLEEIVFRSFKNSGVFHVPRHRISQYVTAMGSMTEGTKITSPDEFDFEVYFPHFSNININISWDNKTENCAKLKYTNTSYLHDNLLRKVIQNGMITKYLLTFFRNRVSSAFNSLHHSNFMVEKEIGTLTTVSVDEGRAGKICVTFNFLWRSYLRNMPLRVKVDLVPGVFLSSSELSKRLQPAIKQLSKILQYDLNQSIQSTRDLFKVAPQYGTFTFCPSYSHMQLNMMLVLTNLRKDLIRCYKLIKYFNPKMSPISSTEIKSLMIHDILSHTNSAKDSMAKCVIELIGKIRERTEGKSCQNVLFPNIFFGYSMPMRSFKCKYNSQLVIVSQSFADVLRHLKDVDQLHFSL